MKNSVNEELSKIIENYFKKGMTSVYIRHSPSEVDFYRWIPTNEFVYRANIFTVPGSFRLWKSAIDIMIEAEYTKEIYKEILNEISKIK